MADVDPPSVADVLIERPKDIARKERMLSEELVVAANERIPPTWTPELAAITRIGVGGEPVRGSLGIVVCCDAGPLVVLLAPDSTLRTWQPRWEELGEVDLERGELRVTLDGVPLSLRPFLTSHKAVSDSFRQHGNVVDVNRRSRSQDPSERSAATRRATLLDDRTVTITDCIVLGGCGIDLDLGAPCQLTFRNESVEIRASRTSPAIPYSTITAVEIGGPGRQVSGSEFTGGGFGLEGAATGMAIAAVANSLSRKESMSTVVRFEFERGELFIHTSSIAPDSLRISLSPLFVALRSQQD